MLITDNEYAKQQEFFDKQKASSLNTKNQNKNTADDYYGFEPLHRDVVNSIQYACKTDQRKAKSRTFELIKSTNQQFETYWKVKTKEKVKQYSNLKFDLNDDNPKNIDEEDRFYFEYIGLPAEINKNVGIESIFGEI